jgi:hypothetical protein
MVFQVLSNGLPNGENLYIKKSEFIPRNLPTVFLKPGKVDDRRGNPTPCLNTREFFVKPGAMKKMKNGVGACQ